MKRFSDYPTVKVIPRKAGDKIFLLTETLGYRTAILDDCPNIIICKGFESDGASVPRIFWSFFPPSGQHLGAAIVHDWLCVTKICTSRQAADIFAEAMRDLGVPAIIRCMMYAGVRIGGPRF
jgi:hypothetical protein